MEYSWPIKPEAWYNPRSYIARGGYYLGQRDTFRETHLETREKRTWVRIARSPRSRMDLGQWLAWGISAPETVPTNGRRRCGNPAPRGSSSLVKWSNFGRSVWLKSKPRDPSVWRSDGKSRKRKTVWSIVLASAVNLWHSKPQSFWLGWFEVLTCGCFLLVEPGWGRWCHVSPVSYRCGELRRGKHTSHSLSLNKRTVQRTNHPANSVYGCQFRLETVLKLSFHRAETKNYSNSRLFGT